MSSKRQILAILAILVAPLVRAAGPPSVLPTTPQLYDARGKLIGTPVPYSNVNNFDWCEFFSFSCGDGSNDQADPSMATAVSVGLKYSGGGTFYLNVFEEPSIDPPAANWLPDTLYYVFPGCLGQAYSDAGNLSYPMAGVLTTRVGAVSPFLYQLYLSSLNPTVINYMTIKSASYLFGCDTFTTTIPNAVAVNPTGISMDIAFTPPFHIQ